MNRGRNRSGWQGLVAAELVAFPAHAQQTAPVPTPAPTPAPSRTPTVITLPGVVPERFSIGPPAATPTPVPVPVPTPAPTLTPAASATPAPRAPAAPVPARARARETAEAQAPIPTPGETPAVAPLPTPVATTAPAPAASAAPEPRPSGTPAWLWALLGAGGTLVVGAAAWLLLRRRKTEPFEEEIVEAPAPPPVPPVPVAPPAGLSPPAPPPAPTGEPFEIALNPLRLEVGEGEVVLELELLVGNLQAVAAEHVRVSLAMMSANPQQDAMAVGFHGAVPGNTAAPPFDLAPGKGGRMPVRLALPRENVHVVDLGGRPIFVPMVLVDLRWRGGLSIKRFGADFMVGTAGQGGKLGPIRLDRAVPAGPLAATRYVAREVAAA